MIQQKSLEIQINRRYALFTPTRVTHRNLARVLQRLNTASTRFQLVLIRPVQSLVAHFGAVRLARVPERAELQLSALPDGGSTWTHVVAADGVVARGKSVVTNLPIGDTA